MGRVAHSVTARSAGVPWRARLQPERYSSCCVPSPARGGRLNTASVGGRTYWRRRVSTVDSVERSFTAGSGLSRTAGKLAAPLRGRHSGREPRVSRRGPRARDPGNALQARVRSRPRAGARSDGGGKDPRTRTVRRSRRSLPRTVGGRRGPRNSSVPNAIKASDAFRLQRRQPETFPPGARLAEPLASPSLLVLLFLSVLLASYLP